MENDFFEDDVNDREAFKDIYEDMKKVDDDELIDELDNSGTPEELDFS